MTLASRIRGIAIAIIRRGDDILVFPVHNSDGSVKGWRPLGGGVEPGEQAADALRREFLEEIGGNVSDVKLWAVLENIFDHEGKAGHEIVFVFEAQLESQTLLAQDAILMNENGEEMWANWVGVKSFQSGENQLFPPQLRAMI